MEQPSNGEPKQSHIQKIKQNCDEKWRKVTTVEKAKKKISGKKCRRNKNKFIDVN